MMRMQLVELFLAAGIEKPVGSIRHQENRSGRKRVLELGQIARRVGGEVTHGCADFRSDTKFLIGASLGRCPPMSSRLIANPVDAAALADELARFRVVDASRLTDLMAEFPGGGATALAGFLVRRGALNHFQAERALAGGARWLNLGPYRLVGESNHGTFGPVYSALHRDRSGEFRLRMFPLRSLWRCARRSRSLARWRRLPTRRSFRSSMPIPPADCITSSGRTRKERRSRIV